MWIIMPGGRPSKPLELVTGHRTKAEKEVRAKAEKELMTGTTLREWPEVKADPVAHKEFGRVKKLLKSIKQDDDLFGAMINTHCKLKGEMQKFEDMKDSLAQQIDQLGAMYSREEIEPLAYIQEKGRLLDRLLSCDKKIMEKRKMMLDISKENIMTIQSALRSVPKKPTEDKKSPMAEYLQRKQAGK
jgi:hypothetical protein